MALLGRNLIVKTDGNPLNTYVFYDDIQLDYVQKIEFDNKVIEVNGKPVEIRALFNTPLVIEVLVPLSDKHILMDYHEKPITKKLYGYGDVIKIAANSIPSSGNAGLPFLRNKMKVLVTGSNGFIGRNLVRTLIANRHEVIASTLDIRNKAEVYNLIMQFQPEVCYHLAAYGNSPYHLDTDKIYTTNIDGIRNLIGALKSVNCNLLVNISTSSVYGYKYTPMQEFEFLQPNSHYAISKATAEHICSYEANDKLAICSLRLFSVYGPWERSYRLIPTAIMQALNNQTITLANPLTARDYIYIDDVIDIMLRITPAHNHKVFNIGNGAQWTIKEVVDTIISLTGSKSNIIYDESKKRPWDSTTWVSNNWQMIDAFGFKGTTLEEGLEKTIEWQKNEYSISIA